MERHACHGGGDDASLPGERPFKCDSCSYLAANQHEVTRHAWQAASHWVNGVRVLLPRTLFLRSPAPPCGTRKALRPRRSGAASQPAGRKYALLQSSSLSSGELSTDSSPSSSEHNDDDVYLDVSSAQKFADGHCDQGCNRGLDCAQKTQTAGDLASATTPALPSADPSGDSRQDRRGL